MEKKEKKEKEVKITKLFKIQLTDDFYGSAIPPQQMAVSE